MRNIEKNFFAISGCVAKLEENHFYIKHIKHICITQTVQGKLFLYHIKHIYLLYFSL
ncbi:hypothetical protein R83H12_00908 [Fibrobacteria bacterium R8-3-H12]